MDKLHVGITLDPEITQKAKVLLKAKGIKLSSWIELKLREFIEHEEILETSGGRL